LWLRVGLSSLVLRPRGSKPSKGIQILRKRGLAFAHSFDFGSPIQGKGTYTPLIGQAIHLKRFDKPIFQTWGRTGM